MSKRPFLITAGVLFIAGGHPSGSLADGAARQRPAAPAVVHEPTAEASSRATAALPSFYVLSWSTIDQGGVPAFSTGHELGLSLGQAGSGSAASSSYQARLGYWYGAPGGRFSGGLEDDHVPAGLGRRVALLQNRPNPFNPATRIAFEIPNAAVVELGVYDVRGRLIKMLAQERRQAGIHSVTWDGRDTAGREAGSGVYLYRLSAGTFRAWRKMVLIR